MHTDGRNTDKLAQELVDSLVGNMMTAVSEVAAAKVVRMRRPWQQESETSAATNLRNNIAQSLTKHLERIGSHSLMVTVENGKLIAQPRGERPSTEQVPSSIATTHSIPATGAPQLVPVYQKVQVLQEELKALDNAVNAYIKELQDFDPDTNPLHRLKQSRNQVLRIAFGVVSTVTIIGSMSTAVAFGTQLQSAALIFGPWVGASTLLALVFMLLRSNRLNVPTEKELQTMLLRELEGKNRSLKPLGKAQEAATWKQAEFMGEQAKEAENRSKAIIEKATEIIKRDKVPLQAAPQRQTPAAAQKIINIQYGQRLASWTDRIIRDTVTSLKQIPLEDLKAGIHQGWIKATELEFKQSMQQVCMSALGINYSGGRYKHEEIEISRKASESVPVMVEAELQALKDIKAELEKGNTESARRKLNQAQEKYQQAWGGVLAAVMPGSGEYPSRSRQDPLLAELSRLIGMDNEGAKKLIDQVTVNNKAIEQQKVAYSQAIQSLDKTIDAAWKEILEEMSDEGKGELFDATDFRGNLLKRMAIGIGVVASIGSFAGAVACLVASASNTSMGAGWGILFVLAVGGVIGAIAMGVHYQPSEHPANAVADILGRDQVRQALSQGTTAEARLQALDNMAAKAVTNVAKLDTRVHDVMEAAIGYQEAKGKVLNEPGKQR